jgi:hypothetical protein
MKHRCTAGALLLALAGCGGTEVLAPEPLVILDAVPGQGALVPAGLDAVVLAFSEPVDTPSLLDAATLEETTEAGGPIRAVSLALGPPGDDAATVTLRTEPLPGGRTFALTLAAARLRAASGARPRSDLVRRFRTR